MTWQRYFGRTRADAEQKQELESYIEITAEEYVAQGMAPDEARRAAQLKLGNLTRIREEVYEMNTATFIESTLQELRHAIRMLRLNPAFSITAILTLALGIGATTAMFSVVNGVVIKPLPYPESEELMTVTHSAVFGNVRGRDFPFSPQMLSTYLASGQAFQEFGMWRYRQTAITGLGDPETAVALMGTQGVLPTLGVPPELGRWFSHADDEPGAPETVILGNGYWQRRFGGDPAVIGRVMTIDSRPRTVIGVMPAPFTFWFWGGVPIDLILPLGINLAQPPNDFAYRAIARLKKGATVEQANADIGRMLPMFLERYAGNRMDALHLQPAVHPLKEDFVGDAGQVLWVLLGSISILLLIACANVANLLLVRAEGRGQELAVRTALGAGWGHIARALMIESLTLSLLGGLLGLGLAYGGLRLLLAYGPSLPRSREIAIDPTVMVFTVVMSIASGLLFGMIPIMKVVGRKSGFSLAEFVRAGGRWASGGKSQHRSQDALVVVQVALALVLLVSSGLMIRTFQNMRNVDPGFTHPETIQTVRIVMPPPMIAEPDSMVREQAQILEQLAAIPGVASAAYVDSLPMDSGANVIVAAQDKTYPEGELPPTRPVKMVSPGVFRTFETRLIAGRDVDWTELYNQRNVALVSEAFARETWNTVEGALGKRISWGPQVGGRK